MKTIVYELNEVPSRVVDFFAEMAPTSNFARLRKFGRCFEATAEDVGHLSPWVTWPSLHKGVCNLSHGITDLGQNTSEVDSEFPNLWTVAANNGISVGVFGPLHSYPLPCDLNNFSFYVPDTFSPSKESFPSELEIFQDFNLKAVKLNGRNVTSELPLNEAVRFITKVGDLGIRNRTVLRAVNQIISEKFNSNRLVRRRTSQAELAFDVFLKQLFSKKPTLSFFFTNHVASSLHRYWPTIFPKDYAENKFDRLWLEAWSAEIPHSFFEADRQIGLLMDFVEKERDFRLVIVSSMGQAAVEDVTPAFNEALITKIDSTMAFLGIRDNDWHPKPAMSPQTVVEISSIKAKEQLERIRGLSVNGSPISAQAIGHDTYRIEVNAKNLDRLVILDQDGTQIDPERVGIQLVNLQDASGAYAYHIPKGILISYQSGRMPTKDEMSWQKCSFLDFGPSMISSLGLEVPKYMSGFRGLFPKP